VPTNRRLVLFAGTGFVLIVIAAVWTVLSGGPSDRGGAQPTPSGSPLPTPSVQSPSPTPAPVPAPSASPSPDSFVLATFNTLGSSHTSRSGKLPELGSGAQRTPGMIGYLSRHHVDVVGLQEFQGPQFRAFKRLAGSTYGVWSASDDTENAIAWRRDRWELVSGRTFAVPYFGGHVRHMPIVRLRDRTTGRVVVFVNVHNPADTRQFHAQGAFRSAAVAREAALLRRLVRQGHPVFLTGDLNDSHSVFCGLTRRGLMVSASGGRTSPCRPPADSGIDWIFGRGGFTFTDYTRDRRPRIDGTSDHPIVTTRVVFRH
jgi:endonuclease/exonuclease/phosphatase family metal-dependent hydrolase